MAFSLVALSTGLVAGLLSGMFGIGGGIITTPVIRLVLGRPELVAVGTPLAVAVPTALAGAFSHLRQGTADAKLGLVIGIWGTPSAVAGALLSRIAGGRAVLLLTAVILLYVAISFLFSHRGEGKDIGSPRAEGDDMTGTATLSWRMGSAEVRTNWAMGLLTGLYAGLFGLGGGAVLVPMLVRWGRLPFKRAIGTSLVSVSVLSIPGAAAHYLLGNVDLGLAVSLALTAIAGAVLGARLTGMAKESVVRIAFSLALAVLAVWLAVAESGAVLDAR